MGTEFFDCLDKMQKTIGSFRGGLAIPSGAVVAFTFDREVGIEPDSERDDPCPDGWSRYRETDGRFILAVGKGPLTKRPNAKSIGGKEEHKLTVDEMPIHAHDSSDGEDLRFVNPRNFSTRSDHHPIVDRSGNRHPYGPGGVKTGNQGGGVAHKIMPPYIALYVCKKD